MNGIVMISFQASNSKVLRNHLKLSGHQPSQEIQNEKTNITKCYTCTEEFSSYWNLMNHRRQKHPSNKICKYFLQNACIHGVNCWYTHDEPMKIESTNKTIKAKMHNCCLCGKFFEDSADLKTHKKNELG